MKKTLIYLFFSFFALVGYSANYGDYLYTDYGNNNLVDTSTPNTRTWYTLYVIKTNEENTDYFEKNAFGNGDAWSNVISFVQNMSATQLASYSNDADNDGLTDVAEIYYFSHPTSGSLSDLDRTLDLDGDGFSDYLEYTKGTNPFSASDYPANTDKDVDTGSTDTGSSGDVELDVEIGGGTTENTSQADELFSSYEKEAVSSDGTAVNDLYATLLGDVDISKMSDNSIISSLTKSDYDGDGLSDYEEIAIGSNPLSYTTLDDDYAYYGEDSYGDSYVDLKDTDGDGVSDYVEDKLGTNSLSSQDTPSTSNILDSNFTYKDSTAGSTSTGFVSVTLSDGDGNYISASNTTTTSGDLVSTAVGTVSDLADTASDELDNLKDTIVGEEGSTLSSYFPDYYSSFIKAIITYLTDVLYPLISSIIDNLVAGFNELSSYLKYILDYLKSFLDLFGKDSSTYEFPYDTFIERYYELQDTFFDRFGIYNFNEYMEGFTMDEVESTVLFTAPLPSVSDDGFTLDEATFELDFSVVTDVIGSPVMRNFLVYILAFSYFFAYIRLFARW